MNFGKHYYSCPDVMELQNVRDSLRRAKKIYADQIAYRQIETKIYESALTFRGLCDNVDALGTALMAMGLQGKHIAIIGEASIEWVTAYFAVFDGLGVVLPIDSALSSDVLTYQLNFGDVDAVFCSAKHLKKLESVLPDCPNIKTVVLMRSLQARGINADDYIEINALMRDGRKRLKNGDDSYTSLEIDPEKMAEIVFTSGTTGANKGVELCHKNLCCMMRGARQLMHYKSTSLSVLPINHTYELSCHIICGIFEGTTVCFNDDLKHVMKNLEHFAPEMTCMVPMMVEAIVRKIRVESSRSGLEKHLQYGIWFSNLIRKFGRDQRKKYFYPILKLFGGNLNSIISGGAPVSQSTIDFMDSIGITVHNGYGITECAPMVATNGDKLHRNGSVGHVMPSCKVRIDQPDENGNGEIQVKGDNVMLGYYKMPEDTAKVFTDDGWFRTGDLGYLDSDQFLYITGRLKNLIILSNGKNVYPEEIEEHMQKDIAYLKEVVVFADDSNTGIYAHCYLDPEQCKDQGIEGTEDKKAYLMRDIQRYNQTVPSFKRITDVLISEEEFAKTTTRKIKRFQVLERSKTHV